MSCVRVVSRSAKKRWRRENGVSHLEVEIDDFHFEFNLPVFVGDKDDHETAVFDGLRDEVAADDVDVGQVALLLRGDEPAFRRVLQIVNLARAQSVETF